MDILDIGVALKKSVAANQGAENFGKILAVGEDGKVVPVNGSGAEVITADDVLYSGSATYDEGTVGETLQETAADVSQLKSEIAQLGPADYAWEYYWKNSYSEKNGNQYMANKNILAVEQWTASKWDQVKLTDDLSAVLIDLENQLGVDALTGWNQGGYIDINVNAGTVISTTPGTSGTAKYVIVDCSAGDTFVINALNVNGVGTWAFVDSDYKRITKSSPTAVCVNTEIVAPADTAHLILNDLSGKGRSYKGAYVKTKISALESAVAVLQTRKVYPSDTSFFVVTANLMNPKDANVVLGGYYDKTNTLQTNSSINQSGFIPVIAGEKYTASYRTAYVVWYDSSKAFHSYTDASSFSSNGYVTAPAGVAFGRFMCVTSSWDAFMVVHGTTLPVSYVAYGVYMPSEYIGASDYQGLSGVAFGTSLTYRSQSTGGYLQYLPGMLGMAIDNQGIGNATILVTEDYPNLDILAAVKGYTGYSGKSVCILEGFVNDFYRNPDKLGTYTDATETTVCGCVRSAINYILTQNPDITLVLVLDHYGKSTSASTVTNDNGDTQFEYYEEIAKVAESLGIPVIKGYAISGMNELTPDYFIDNIHPTAAGAKQFAHTIFSGIKQIVPKVTTA